MTGDRPHDGHVGDLVSALLDGELDAETSAGVVAHLDECAACRELAEETELARAWVRSLPEVDASDVVDRLLARHRVTIRAGAAFVGFAAVILGALALSAAVLHDDIVPEIDALVATHRATVADGDPALPSGHAGLDAVSDLDGMAKAEHVSDVGRPYSAPAAMVGNRSSLSRRAVIDGEDLTVVVYGDGDAVVSVFQQPGRLAWEDLPPGATERVGRRTVWVPTADPESSAAGRETVVMVSEVGHLVVTVVAEDLVAALTVVDGLPDVERDSAWDRLHDACARLTATFALDV